MMDQRMMEDRNGFTLLEMIISLTILSMVVLTVYVAFSLGVDVWRRMDSTENPEQRRAIALRLLQNDFAHIQPYTVHRDQESYPFYSGGPQCLLYVTTSPLASSQMQDKGLFFSCLFLHSTDEHGLCLFLYKTNRPSEEILDVVREFRSGGSLHQECFIPPERIRSKSVVLVKNVGEAVFGYQGPSSPLFSGAKTDVESEKDQKTDSGSLARKVWVENELPGQMSFQAQGGQSSLFVHTLLSDHAVIN